MRPACCYQELKSPKPRLGFFLAMGTAVLVDGSSSAARFLRHKENYSEEPQKSQAPMLSPLRKLHTSAAFPSEASSTKRCSHSSTLACTGPFSTLTCSL